MELDIVKRTEGNKEVTKIAVIPGISAMGAITLLSRIGDIKRFKTPDSLANDFGLTPGCHNTAGKQRLGGITKAGSPIARQVLNFAVIHVVRKDPEMKAWHKKIKTRRGAKIARVAVMRKLATINGQVGTFLAYVTRKEYAYFYHHHKRKILPPRRNDMRKSFQQYRYFKSILISVPGLMNFSMIGWIKCKVQNAK